MYKRQVIDHHRRAADYIENAVVSLHEPYASSASELVSELLQYLVPTSGILTCEAEAMLAGIYLDTKGFSTRTGVRTFEAAAYLRRAGAESSDVKRLFQSSFDQYMDCLLYTSGRFSWQEKRRGSSFSNCTPCIGSVCCAAV